MAILIFEHDSADASCRLGQILRDCGHRLHVIQTHQTSGDSLPIDLANIDGVVSMGGPMNVDEQEAYPWMQPQMQLIRVAHDSRLPVVGVCLGAQLVSAALGGQVGPMDRAEIGFGPVELTFAGKSDPVFSGLPWHTNQFHAHSQQVSELPQGATPLATSPACTHQAFRVGLTTYGFQYHFEWSRADINRFVCEQADWIQGHGQDPDAVREGGQAFYALYRHLGDRLCHRLVDLVFPIDKRLDHKIGPVQNYHASYF